MAKKVVGAEGAAGSSEKDRKAKADRTYVLVESIIVTVAEGSLAEMKEQANKGEGAWTILLKSGIHSKFRTKLESKPVVTVEPVE